MDYERTGFPNTASVVGTEVGASFKGLGDNTSEGDKTCLAFLDKALTQRGPDSALYMSFGTLMYPDLEHIRYLLEVLMSLEEPIPFIFATAGMRPIVSDEMAKKVNESGRGLIVPWAPQQAIFLHPATGWALSHCGAGAMYESLCQSVPLIAWPIAVDQPQHARWMSETLDTAFELLQVRVGLGQKKAFRGGPEGTEIVGTEEAIKAEIRDVLKRCKSEEGHRKRANAKRVKQQIKEARTAGGQIDQHYELLRQAIVV
ncbi:UDP-Glycosyltransferase/glycogen phosphorylase [Dacryopinax primogenitus]|uniref:UDP-Glycosyltransferase/glycogen phosphorylase n=1 Tax=Dacryopinax primogenitus (strain DJM 731) TaxID=1858805 RepID=M5GCR5_DACPD|nr:UDP-Glycosyltransferase/glycogen phosphorylase [Dacryopinax primogenitus]EJU04017.1 UDP-Glycosyltransferase/glycogen phosphorylase [Dacryopinax primogenitus]